jgi:hypothetical protein
LGSYAAECPSTFGVSADMAKAGKIALFNIQSSEELLTISDTNLVNYLIYDISGALYNSEHVPLEKSIMEYRKSGKK